MSIISKANLPEWSSCMSSCSRLGSRVLNGPTGQILKMVQDSMVKIYDEQHDDADVDDQSGCYQTEPKCASDGQKEHGLDYNMGSA